MKTYSLIIFVILNSCVTKKIAVKTGIEEIHFGSGGGFTGEIKSYKLIADSKLFANGKEPRKIDANKTLELFIYAKELKDFQFNEPDNIYSFIEIKTKDKINRIVWAYGASTVDKKVTELYNNLISITK